MRAVRWLRVAGALQLMTAAWYVPWLLASADWSTPWLSVPFVAANLWVTASVAVTAVNNWHRSVPRPRPVALGDEPHVAVIVPTCGEPVTMLERTVASVLAQDWPHDRMVVVVSDDGHDRDVRRATLRLATMHPLATVLYHSPPPRGHPARRGDAKAGNLNAAYDRVRVEWPALRFVETRDADDEVGDQRFLREVVGQLIDDRRVAFVQTIKEARVSPGDPFGNNDPLFYRGAMLARNAANAVFPCGSGLVWRVRALDDIGGFPTWNLVEDLQSGVEALRRGWRGLYVPVVGAIAQTAPEDIPNVYKQRGTWALDTIRLLVFGQLRGLSLRQRLHFVELGMFYGLSLATLVLLVCPIVALTLARYPLVTTQQSYIAHFWPFAVSVELFLAALASGHRYEVLWRARQMWVGMAPVYARACWLALRYGARRKPAYRVTRKTAQIAWYWRETMPQTMLLVGLIAAVAYSAATSSILERLDVGSAYWAGFAALLLAGFVRRSWHGLRWRAGRAPRPAPASASVPALASPPPAPIHARGRIIDLTGDGVRDGVAGDGRGVVMPFEDIDTVRIVRRGRR